MNLNDVSKQINKWRGDGRLYLAAENQLNNVERITEFLKITNWQPS